MPIKTILIRSAVYQPPRSAGQGYRSADILKHKMSDVAGFVTAGGRSSRMGTNKAWLELAGRPMIAHVIAALQPVSTSVAIVANNPEYAELGFPVFTDSQIGIGPLE